MEPNADCTPELGEEAPDKGTMGATTAPKPQNKSKRQSAPRRRSSQISTTEPPSGPYNAEGNPADQNPDLLVENPSRSPELPSIPGLANRKGGRRQFCPITEPNVPTPDPCTVFPLPDEEPYLPIDEILQSAGPEKVVRRSMRLRRGSGASGLFWVPEKSSSEAPSRRKSLSSALQPLENRNPTLETQTLPMDQHAPSEATKSRRRTLCTSTLQQTSLCDPKRRRSNVSHKDSAQPITSFTLDT
uniref:Uncharacterized protein n=2 Tax=Pyxicephalus adspersus TaxID=30357 RepID=A0AAV3B4C1_PYXAD|nr:TPA: hypothetical protein GDO54_007913 [Pyxicephalus adspersus]